MPLTQDEIFDNLSKLFADLAKASLPDSQGGKSITSSEWIDMGISLGINIAKDIQD